MITLYVTDNPNNYYRVAYCMCETPCKVEYMYAKGKNKWDVEKAFVDYWKHFSIVILDVEHIAAQTWREETGNFWERKKRKDK